MVGDLSSGKDNIGQHKTRMRNVEIWKMCFFHIFHFLSEYGKYGKYEEKKNMDSHMGNGFEIWKMLGIL